MRYPQAIGAVVPGMGATTAGVTCAPTTSAANADDGYALMEDCEYGDEAEQFVSEIATVQSTIRGLRLMVDCLLLLVAGILTGMVAMVYHLQPVQNQQRAVHIAFLASIPIVALVFTWFHIWLAIQMMFRPINFIGLWQDGSSGLGLGWQGIVPRKAHKMAKLSYACARPNLDGPREYLTRVNPKELVARVKPQVRDVIQGALETVGSRHFPRVNGMLPTQARENITQSALEKIQERAPELWGKFMDILCREDGLDNDGMYVKVLTENKELLNTFFQKLGDKEFRFIEHCGAAMGFFCGILQLIAFNNLGDLGRAIFLPATGFFLGIFTNWLAIFLVFKPCFPKPVTLCGWHIYDIQGLFLKRQADVAILYSKLLVENFLSFDKIIDYLASQPVLWEQLKAEYTKFSTQLLRQTMGLLASVAPLALGQAEYQALERDLEESLVLGLANAKNLHKISARYLGQVTDIERNNRQSLQSMPPDQFENLLHPVFQEDEWILILVGGILGAIVGQVQYMVLT